MGQRGYIRLFTSQKHDPSLLILRTMQVLDATKATFVTRVDGNEWERFQQDRQIMLTDEDEYTILHTEGAIIRQVPPGPPSTRFRDLSVDEVVSKYVDRACLHVEPESQYGWKLDKPLRDIEEAIRGAFVPNGITFYVGWHDIYECAEHEEGHLFGTAFFSLSLMGWSTPRDWDEYRRLVVQVPEIQELKRSVEKFAGELETAIYWWI